MNRNKDLVPAEQVASTRLVTGGAAALAGPVAAGRAAAAGPLGLGLAFGWGAAEALWWPLMPDLAVALLALAAPERWWRLAASAASGSMAGGAVAHQLGANKRVPPLPLVTPRMRHRAAGWLAEEGAVAVRRQPASGIPFKVFAYQAGEEGIELPGFIAVAATARGLRLAGVAAAFGGVGHLIRRRCPEHLRPLATTAALAATVAGFGIGLARVVAAWSGEED